jgi:hypothetical protein
VLEHQHDRQRAARIDPEPRPEHGRAALDDVGRDAQTSGQANQRAPRPARPQRERGA